MIAADLKRNGDGVLPDAQRERWQAIRGGLLNIYRYDYQEFKYEDGRLLLRGNNGTGKSRVLALQLPFLLDGEILPQRVEPDQDQAKRMEWNSCWEASTTTDWAIPGPSSDESPRGVTGNTQR